jgi:hypothetical protein
VVNLRLQSDQSDVAQNPQSTSSLSYHSFLTRGFSQHCVLFEVLFEIALDVKGAEGAATAQEAEAKAQTVAEVKRILRLMVQYEKPWESTSYFY